MPTKAAFKAACMEDGLLDRTDLVPTRGWDSPRRAWRGWARDTQGVLALLQESGEAGTKRGHFAVWYEEPRSPVAAIYRTIGKVSVGIEQSANASLPCTPATPSLLSTTWQCTLHTCRGHCITWCTSLPVLPPVGHLSIHRLGQTSIIILIIVPERSYESN